MSLLYRRFDLDRTDEGHKTIININETNGTYIYLGNFY